MKAKVLVLAVCLLTLTGCMDDSGGDVIETTSSSVASSETTSETTEIAEETKTIQFIEGVTENITNGDKYNHYALKGQADGFEQITAIIEGTAVDIRQTDNQWYFDYPYPASNIETEITFTTDESVEYGQTDIDLADLEPDSYVTLTFLPNEDPTIELPSVTVSEGQPHTFRNEESGIIEVVTVTEMKVVEPEADLQALGEELLQVDVTYVNDGTATTYIAPNYFSAVDGEGHFLPLRYSHFWLHNVEPGDSFSETIYFDVTDEGPYMIQFFDGAWEDVNGSEDIDDGTEI